MIFCGATPQESSASIICYWIVPFGGGQDDRAARICPVQPLHCLMMPVFRHGLYVVSTL